MTEESVQSLCSLMILYDCCVLIGIFTLSSNFKTNNPKTSFEKKNNL